jgi:hypothetical protein
LNLLLVDFSKINLRLLTDHGDWHNEHGRGKGPRRINGNRGGRGRGRGGVMRGVPRTNGREGYSDEFPVDFTSVDFPQPNAKFGAQPADGLGYMMPFVNPFFYNNGMDEAMLKEYIKKQM